MVLCMAVLGSAATVVIPALITQTKRQSSALLAHTLSGTPSLLLSCARQAPASDRQMAQSWQPPQSRFAVPLPWSTPPHKSRAAVPGSAFQVRVLLPARPHL